MNWVSDIHGWDFREEMAYYGIKKVDDVYNCYSMPALFAKPEFIGCSPTEAEAKRICESHREGIA